MQEPRLEDISDYNTLKGEKKRIVWAVIIAGLLIGTVYMIAYKIYNGEDDMLHVKDEITVVPLSKNIPIR